MRVVVTEAAEADLSSIADYIQLHDPQRAWSFVDELLASCGALSEMPRAYPLVPRYEHWGIRRRVHGNYLIFYRVREQWIEIIRVIHGAQDYATLLFF